MLYADIKRMKLVLTITLLLSVIYSKAQNGFFVRPSYGAGISNIEFKSKTRTINNKQSIFSNSISIAFGFEHNNLRINSGLGYLKTGYKIRDYTTIYIHLQPVLSDADFTYAHIIIPIQVGYIQNITNKLSVVPGAGFVFCANLGENIIYRNFEKTLKSSVNNIDFKSIYHSFNYMANGSIYLEYKLKSNFNVYAGPSIHYMVPNFLKTDEQQHNYAILIDLGIVLHMHKPAKKRVPY
jgi:hypothetical protein